MFKKILYISILFTTFSHAFISLAPPVVGEKEGYDGEVALGAKFSSGNSDSSAIGIGLKGQYTQKEWLLYLIAAYDYGEVNEHKNTNDGLIHLRYVHSIENTKYDYELFLQSEFNEFQSIKMRNLAGANIRRKLDYPFDKFYIGLGLFYSYMEPDSITDMDPIYKQTKVNSYISFSHNITESFSVTYLGFYQVTIDDISDLRVFQVLQLDTKLTENLSLGFDIKHEYNKTPYFTIDKNDIQSTINLKYKF